MEVVLHSQPLTQSKNMTSSTPIHVDSSNANGEQLEHDQEAMLDSAYGTSCYERLRRERERERGRGGEKTERGTSTTDGLVLVQIMTESLSRATCYE